MSFSASKLIRIISNWHLAWLPAFVIALFRNSMEPKVILFYPNTDFIFADTLSHHQPVMTSSFLLLFCLSCVAHSLYSHVCWRKPTWPSLHSTAFSIFLLSYLHTCISFFITVFVISPVFIFQWIKATHRDCIWFSLILKACISNLGILITSVFRWNVVINKKRNHKSLCCNKQC